MANPIDLIVTQDALKQLDSMISKITTAREGLLTLGESALGLSKNPAKINTPSGLNNNSALNAQINADLQKQRKLVEDLHATIAKKAEQSRLAEIKLQQAREKAFDAFEKNVRKETALAEKNANAYNKMQTQVNRLTLTYNDLAIRKARYNNLNDNEEKRLVTLSAVNEKYNGVLKATDAIIGKNQRNVGNYASGYNALGNSINQLSREAPAFANSVNTGFMALSNNFPALFDAINGIRDKNKMLVAEGKPTVSVLKSIAGALFSWQTLLSIGVTLLTLYGGKIVSWIGSLASANKGVQSLAENQKQLNESLKESSGSYAEEKVNIDVLYQTATKLNGNYKDRKRAVDELQELYPFYFKNLSDEEIMTGKAKDQYNLLSQAIVTVAKARASEEILQKRESERLVSEQKDIDLTMKKYGELAKAKGTTTYVSGGGSVAGAGTSSVQETASQQKARLRNEIQELRTESIKQREKWAKEDAFFIEKIAQGNTVEQTLKPAEKATKGLTDAKEKKVKVETLEINSNFELVKSQDTALEKLKQLKQALEKTRDETSKNSTEFQQFETTIKAVNESIDFLTKGIDPIKLDIKKPFVEGTKEIEELQKATDNWLGSFSSEFLQNSGMGSLETFFDGTFSKLLEGADTTKEKFAVTFNAIAESAQEAFNLISGFSQANFDGEKKRIEDQQVLAISYAGGSAVAIAKINEDADKRKKDIANRENKAKQKQALFNIAIDTAQGVISALASTPPNIPLSIFIGGLGLIQAGLVASQKIPQYFDGGVHEQGGLAMINDAKGNNYIETVVTPDGKARQFSGRDVVTNLPKGTEIFTPEQWHEKQILAMMQGNNINISANKINNSITKNDMDNILGKHFSNIKTQTMSIDRKGFTQYIKNGNSTTILNNARFSGTGLSV